MFIIIEVILIYSFNLAFSALEGLSPQVLDLVFCFVCFEEESVAYIFILDFKYCCIYIYGKMTYTLYVRVCACVCVCV